MGRYIFAVDPGSEESAWVHYDADAGRIISFSNGEENEALFARLRSWVFPLGMPRLACEMVASYGMPVGMTTFETCVVIGRLVEIWNPDYDWRVYRVQDVKMHVCGDSRAKDANIRRALLDRFPAGNKKVPGPSYGLSGDGWSALAIAVTVAEGGVRHKTIAQQIDAQADRRAKRAAKRAAA